jgi:predicted O-methyltransferase YrrM
MNIGFILGEIEPLVRAAPLRTLGYRLAERFGVRVSDDPCPDVVGMASAKKLKLLNLAVRHLPRDGSECYFEVGTFQGKSLIAAGLGNNGRLLVACDNFSLFDNPSQPKNKELLLNNLQRYNLQHQVRFFDEDFATSATEWQFRNLPPIGVYFYDGAHDEESQYNGIRLVEPLLADSAIVIIDDWRHAMDSDSYAESGTRRALAQSKNNWRIDYILPAKFNGDKALWWNGVAVLSFKRAS